MLEALTDEQEKLLDQVADEWIGRAHSGEILINQIQARQAIHSIYREAELAEPQTMFFQGPIEAIAFCHEIGKKDVNDIDYFGLGFDAGWVSWTDLYQRIGVLPEPEPAFEAFKELSLSGVWATILFDGLAICISRPALVKTDEGGNLHSAEGPALAFADGYEEYAWHGTWVTEQIIMKPETLTKKEILAEKNSEVSRAMAERLGWDEYMKRVETILVDKWECAAAQTDGKMTVLHFELYDFRERRGTLQPRLLKMESPRLNDGGRPYYIEPVDPGLKTAEAARRWQCDPQGEEFKDRPADWVAECNKNPGLKFEVEA